MKITSAEANKLLKTLNDDITAILEEEKQVCEFNVASGEDEDKLRPEYDYFDFQARLTALERKVRKIKHALNVFNTTTVVPGFDMTIDEALVYLPQLTRDVHKYSAMKSNPPRRRYDDRYNSKSYIDYIVLNYDRTLVAKDYETERDMLCTLQLALDSVNTSKQFEVDI